MDVNPTPSASSVAPAACVDAEQPAGTPETDELRGRILRRIIDLSEAVSPPPLWAQFGSGTSVRRFPGEPNEVLSQLTREFTEDQLLAARVTVRTRAGELELSKVLTTNEAFLIRGDAAGHSAGDIVTQRGKLSTGACEWRERAAETTNKRSQQPIVLCASDAELYVLVRVGMSCSPTAGVDQLIGRQVRTLFQTRPTDAWQRQYQIVLLGWQPEIFSNEPSAKNLAAIRHVAAIERVFGFDPHSLFSVWLPTGEELSRIRQAHSFLDRQRLAAEFKASLAKSVYAPADALALLADRTPATWSTARATLESAIEQSTLVPRVAETHVALEKLERAFHDQVVQPLEAAAGKTGLEALVSIIVADLALTWCEDLDLVQAARRAIAGQYPGNVKCVNDAALSRKLRLVGAIVKLASTKFEK
jgi:hypothetical protein